MSKAVAAVLPYGTPRLRAIKELPNGNYLVSGHFGHGDDFTNLRVQIQPPNPHAEQLCKLVDKRNYHMSYEVAEKVMKKLGQPNAAALNRLITEAVRNLAERISRMDFQPGVGDYTEITLADLPASAR